MVAQVLCMLNSNNVTNRAYYSHEMGCKIFMHHSSPNEGAEGERGRGKKTNAKARDVQRHTCKHRFTQTQWECIECALNLEFHACILIQNELPFSLHSTRITRMCGWNWCTSHPIWTSTRNLHMIKKFWRSNFFFLCCNINSRMFLLTFAVSSIVVGFHSLLKCYWECSGNELW